MRLLLLEDDTILSDIITEYLREAGYDVDTFSDGMQALNAIEQGGYDLLLLDVNVPSLDGFELLTYLRDIGTQTPAIYLTSLATVEALKKGFAVGGDDYLKKPFELEELVVRIEHIAKSRHIDDVFKLGSICLSSKSHRLQVGDETFVLRQKEVKILRYLMRNEGRIVTFDELISDVWQGEELPTHATIRTYIKNLRKLLPEGAIENIKGEGYRFNIV